MDHEGTGGDEWREEISETATSAKWFNSTKVAGNEKSEFYREEQISHIGVGCRVGESI